MQSKQQSVGFLDKVERICAKIPQPIPFFLWLMLIALVLSGMLSFFGTSFNLIAIKDGQSFENVHYIKNILTADGIRFILNRSITGVSSSNIIPILIVAVMGLGLAEGSGYIKALLVSILGRFKSSAKIATILILTLGVNSNIAIDAGYVVLIPLGGMIYAAVGRNPMLGIILAFVGVSGGFTANLFLGGTDVILAGITTTAAKIIMPEYVVPIESNYYFAIISTFVIIASGFFLTELFMAKKFKGENQEDGKMEIEKLTPLEKKALKYANISILLMIAILMFGVVPENGILRNQETGDLWRNSALSNGIIAIFSIIFGVSGLVYGKINKTINNSNDAVRVMSHFVGITAASIMILIIAYQFLSMLEFSGLALGLASVLTQGIKALNVGGPVFLILMVLAVGFINLFIGSASVKWTAISYVIVPVFVSFGYTPELAQAAFRIGDSATNIISPAVVYMPIVLGQLQKYKKNANLGTIFSMTLPYSIMLLVVWIALLIVFFQFNLPLGPGAYSVL